MTEVDERLGGERQSDIAIKYHQKNSAGNFQRILIEIDHQVEGKEEKMLRYIPSGPGL